MPPVIIGLLLITIVFSTINPAFLAPNNLVNLLFDTAAVGLISLRVFSCCRWARSTSPSVR